MLRSNLTTLSALAVVLLAGGCNLEQPEMDDAVPPTAMASAPAAPQGQEISRMFEAEKQSAAQAELPTQF